MPKVGDYDLHGAPASWSKVVALRHALTKFPDCRYLWYLDQDSFIMNPTPSLEEHLMEPKKLESLMIKDHPVVPPDSIIKTFSHLRGDEVDFVLCQDREGLSSGSFVLRNGEWAKYFLDTWFGPLYRSYNFLKAETHALVRQIQRVARVQTWRLTSPIQEHIVQWHPTILSKLALIPQRTINSYNYAIIGERYETGDMVVRFPGCTKTGDISCEQEAERFFPQWQAAFQNA
jgi:mannan polymerase II complex MNN11 subunit